MSESSTRNLQVTLKSRPQGWVRESDFALVESPLPAIAEGEVLLKTLYLSLDPYMRGRMDDVKSYAASVNLGDVMVGGTVSEVADSRHPKFKAGDVVVSPAGWQRYSKANGDQLMRVPAGLPPSVFLGPAGMPGVTAWMGLFDIGQPKEGETVVVSAASGAVGSVVGQLAKEKGCRAVGIAGGPEKCAYVVDTLGFDACIDYKRDGWIAGTQERDARRRRCRVRKRRRRGAGQRVAPDQPEGAHCAVRTDRRLQRDRADAAA